jgi:hypothetical protein
MQWTDSDALNATDALVVGGPSDGLRIPVRHQLTEHVNQYRYPDAFDATGYVYHDRMASIWDDRDKTGGL